MYEIQHFFIVTYLTKSLETKKKIPKRIGQYVFFFELAPTTKIVYAKFLHINSDYMKIDLNPSDYFTNNFNLTKKIDLIEKNYIFSRLKVDHNNKKI